MDGLTAFSIVKSQKSSGLLNGLQVFKWSSSKSYLQKIKNQVKVPKMDGLTAYLIVKSHKSSGLLIWLQVFKWATRKRTHQKNLKFKSNQKRKLDCLASYSLESSVKTVAILCTICFQSVKFYIIKQSSETFSLFSIDPKNKQIPLYARLTSYFVIGFHVA